MEVEEEEGKKCARCSSHRSVALPLSSLPFSSRSRRSDLFQGVLEGVLRVLVQTLDAAERDEVGEVGHGGETERKKKQKSNRRKKRKQERK